MILFKPEHVDPILAGRKTQTRRLWKRPRAKPGGVHNCYTRPAWCNPPGEPFARVEILRAWQEPLGEISADDARAEGYRDRLDYLAAFDRINGPTDRGTVVWCVEFRLSDATHRDRPYRRIVSRVEWPARPPQRGRIVEIELACGCCFTAAGNEAPIERSRCRGYCEEVPHEGR